MSILKVNTIQKKDGTQFPLVGQVVSTSSATIETLTSTSWTDTGLSVTLTPTSTSSKILVRCNWHYGLDATYVTWFHYFRIVHSGSTNVINNDIQRQSGNGDEENWHCSMESLHSANTTSPITYTFQMKCGNASQTIYLNTRGYPGSSTLGYSTITAMEVLA